MVSKGPSMALPESSTNDFTSKKSRGEPEVLKNLSAFGVSLSGESLTHTSPQKHRSSGQSLAYTTEKAAKEPLDNRFAPTIYQ